MNDTFFMQTITDDKPLIDQNANSNHQMRRWPIIIFLNFEKTDHQIVRVL